MKNTEGKLVSQQSRGIMAEVVKITELQKKLIMQGTSNGHSLVGLIRYKSKIQLGVKDASTHKASPDC